MKSLNPQMNLFSKANVENRDGLRIPSFEDYLTEDKPAYHHQGLLVFNNSKNWEAKTVLVDGNLVYCHDDGPLNIREESKARLTEDVPAGVITNITKRFKENAKYRKLVLLNGDQNEDDDLSAGNGPELNLQDDCPNMPTCSFACLVRFYSPRGNLEKFNSVMKRLATGEIKVLDYTLDEHRHFSAEDKKIMRRKKDNEPRPPEPGFVKIGRGWHRSGTVLFYDQKNSMCLLLGQDENTYFGVQLPKKVATIKDAFKLLMPKEVWNRPFVRQGEWFLVPVNEKKVPKGLDCSVVSDGHCRDMILPLETPDSNHHHLECDELRIGKDGIAYALNPSLEHEQHASVKVTGWGTFYRNTAVRSFSEEGVD
jgi:hypothetical protein